MSKKPPFYVGPFVILVSREVCTGPFLGFLFALMSSLFYVEHGGNQCRR